MQQEQPMSCFLSISELVYNTIRIEKKCTVVTLQAPEDIHEKDGHKDACAFFTDVLVQCFGC